MIKRVDDGRLHRALRQRICERIYRGEYRDGENLPPERVLAQSLDISRVTVRRALAQLAAEGIITRVQGSGNRVSLPVVGHHGTLEIIAVLAHAQNVFFASFIDCFQRTAERHDALVLFMQTPSGERLEEGLFKLLQKDIRNAVIWPEDQPVDREALRRLRGLGMNMVLFDAPAALPYADGVLLDNDAAIAALYGVLAQRCGAAGSGRIAYVGWDGDAIASARLREDAFVRVSGGCGACTRLAWSERARLDILAAQLAGRLADAPERPAAVLCGDGEIGVALRRALVGQGLATIDVASPDDYPPSDALGISVYRQDFASLAQQTYACLHAQTEAGWAAATYCIAGEAVVRYAATAGEAIAT